MTRHLPRPHRQHGLPRWQRALLYLSGLLLLATGIAWLFLHYGAGTDGLPHPLEAWTMRVHGFAAFFGLFMFGALSAAHIPHGWRMSGRQRWAQQRGSGLVMCGLAGMLALTGYLLYYFAPEGIRPQLGWVHSGIGGLLGVLLLLHRRPKSRRLREDQASPKGNFQTK